MRGGTIGFHDWDTEVKDIANKNYRLSFQVAITEDDVDFGFVVILTKMKSQGLDSLLQMKGNRLTSPDSSQEIDSHISNMRAAAERVQWLDTSKGSKGPALKESILKELTELEFAVQFGRQLREPARKLSLIETSTVDEERRMLFQEIQQAKAELEALLQMRKIVCPARFAKHWSELCNRLKLLEIIF